jgi:hypothetical protein
MPPTPRKTSARKATTPAEPPAMPMPPQDKYAPTAWTGSSDGEPEDLTVPSGQTCLVRRPGIEQLLREGVLFDSDTLSTIVHENIQRVERGLPQKEIDIEEFMRDPVKFQELLNTTDRIVCACVLKPTVKRTPNDPTGRQPGVVYTDMIALEDKFAILEFALGGSRTLASFREGPGEGVGGVRPRKGTSGPTKRTARRK